jgi:hypothetical protein
VNDKMRNGKPVQWICNLDINCLDCGEVVWCFSDAEIDDMIAERKACSPGVNNSVKK